MLFRSFEVDSLGQLTNWSGCGNDVRCRSAMARRLIADSLIHLVEAYGVDGFRFDLAELIGRDVLVDLERRLKQVKPDIILIAEPWSFRGHIAGALRDTGYASWKTIGHDAAIRNAPNQGLHLGVIDAQDRSAVERDVFDELLERADRKSTRLNSSHSQQSRMPSSA